MVWKQSREKYTGEKEAQRRGENKRVDEGKKGNKGDDLVIKRIMTHVCEDTIIKLIILYATSKS